MRYVFGDCEVDTSTREVRRSGEPQRVEPQVFDVLVHLIDHRDRAVSKEELLDGVWGDRFVSESTLTSRIKSARRAVGDDGREQSVIRTVRGHGYRFVGDLRVTTAVAEDTERDGTATAGTLLGRAGELAALRGELRAVLGGGRGLVFVSGEPGMGKTALVETFRASCLEVPGLAVGHGGCVEQHGSGEPYLPVLEALDQLCQGDGGSVVADLLEEHAPTWLMNLPGVLSGRDVASLQVRTLGSTRERMLRELGHALTVITRRQAVVLVLEDLQWSDHATASMLGWLGSQPRGLRLLVVGTYRRAELQARSHPLAGVVAELRAHQRCRELALPPLDEAAVAAFACEHLGAPADTAVVEALRGRTEGNPLFLTNVLRSWVEQGLLRTDGDEVTPAVGLAELDEYVPADLRELIVQRWRRLDDRQRTLLEAASAAGRGFPAAAVAAAVAVDADVCEDSLASLARTSQFIEERPATAWSAHGPTGQFAFTHDLYRSVIHDQIPAGRRARLHGSVGRWLEDALGPRADQRAAELAAHFVAAHEPAAALRHLRTAAEQALQRNAYAEAVRHARAGLERTTVIEDATEAARAEVALQTLLASSLIPLRGWADGDVEQAYRRACVLGDHLGDDRYAFRARYGLATLHEYRAEYERSQELMRQGLDRAADADDSSLIVSHELLACSQYHQGHFDRALQNASHGLQLYDPDRHLQLMAGAGEDPAVACHAWAAHSSWFLGDEDAALDHIAQALVLAGDNRRAFSLAYAHEQAAILHQHRDRPDLVAHHAAEASRLGAEHGYPYRQATGAILHGWAVAAGGAPAQGRAELEDGIRRYRATGAAMDLPYFLALLANVVIRMDDTAAASTALDEADALVAERPAYFYLPELARLRGLVHLVEGDLDAARAHLLESRRYAQRAGSLQLLARAEATLSEGLPDTVTGATDGPP
ncbi:MAG TPA: AAA family ATPase [Euzebyales bacterium]